ncbi:CrcB family protein [Arthrobacter sp. B10-11]|jgi:fluoride exporter|uniref:fluoride efflux transporter FluC n=1 Tax=Arthrobacter sp. B10-11 TaxID=3081160 RepID=UPI0029530B68|nr:CrcB family protein [Arthrobacter sp. B10-11]MDV8146465.1 CrcB family protein [Arthrobacter sp. B10-11]
MTALLVGVFGVAGGLLRFSIDTWFAHRTGNRRHWPWATLLVNVLGSLIIGLSLGVTGRLGLGGEWQAAIATGLAGGLTTFSSWTTATIRLVSEVRYLAAALNVIVNLVAGLSAAALGIAVAG